LASSPILAEMTCLRLSKSRQLVVVLLKERSLRMTDEKENSHYNPALPSNVILQAGIAKDEFAHIQPLFSN